MENNQMFYAKCFWLLFGLNLVFGVLLPVGFQLTEWPAIRPDLLPILKSGTTLLFSLLQGVAFLLLSTRERYFFRTAGICSLIVAAVIMTAAILMKLYYYYRTAALFTRVAAEQAE